MLTVSSQHFFIFLLFPCSLVVSACCCFLALFSHKGEWNIITQLVFPTLLVQEWDKGVKGCWPANSKAIEINGIQEEEADSDVVQLDNIFGPNMFSQLEKVRDPKNDNWIPKFSNNCENNKVLYLKCIYSSAGHDYVHI